MDEETSSLLIQYCLAMDYSTYSERFTEKAHSFGYSAEIISRCLNYARPLLDQKLPVIYNHSHLASLVGYNANYLLRAITYPKYFYRNFTVCKKSGKGERSISEPLPSLKEIQRWILEEILYKCPISKYAKAYVPEVTIKQNVVFHRDTALVLTLDIQDFFPSIKIKSVRQTFHLLGYSHTLSNLLSKLCCYNDRLPQGAPTSPYLSNIYLNSFDEVIGNFCMERKIRFSRYADDITFSGEFDPREVEDLVKKELEVLSLSLNDGKKTLMKRSDRQIVTGIVVNDKLQVRRTERKEIRQTIYYINKFGLSDHMKFIKLSRKRYLEHLLGRINFILFINNDDKEFLKYRDIIVQKIRKI